MSVNLHAIFSEGTSRLPYTREVIFDENMIALLEHRDRRFIRVMIGILMNGNDDRLIKHETYNAVVSELNEAIAKKLFNGHNLFAHLGTSGGYDD